MKTITIVLSIIFVAFIVAGILTTGACSKKRDLSHYNIHIKNIDNHEYIVVENQWSTGGVGITHKVNCRFCK